VPSESCVKRTAANLFRYRFSSSLTRILASHISSFVIFWRDLSCAQAMDHGDLPLNTTRFGKVFPYPAAVCRVWPLPHHVIHIAWRLLLVETQPDRFGCSPILWHGPINKPFVVALPKSHSCDFAVFCPASLRFGTAGPSRPDIGSLSFVIRSLCSEGVHKGTPRLRES
jgi:hypothetical protein